MSLALSYSMAVVTRRPREPPPTQNIPSFFISASWLGMGGVAAALTCRGDVHRVAGVADVAASEGHQAELIEGVLGVGVGGRAPSPLIYCIPSLARPPPTTTQDPHLDEPRHQHLALRAGNGALQHLPTPPVLPQLQGVTAQRHRELCWGLPTQQDPPRRLVGTQSLRWGQEDVHGDGRRLRRHCGHWEAWGEKVGQEWGGNRGVLAIF